MGKNKDKSKPTFASCLINSSLVTADDLREAGRQVQEELLKNAKAPPQPGMPRTSRPTDEQLAAKLVELGKLNRWQADQLLAGRSDFHLGPYHLIDSLGYGGMGQVFKAEHTIMGREVAVKVLPRSKSSPSAIKNFLKEVRTQARLDHENLVRAHDAGFDKQVHFLVTEYVPGTDLRKLIRREGPLSMEAAASIVLQAACGLDYAHKQGLIHRDIKPGNILVTPDGRAKVSDLGLASFFSETDGPEDDRKGKVVGTADYIAPEQIAHPGSASVQSDIYSLGCTLYYAVTGKVPFPGGDHKDKWRRHRLEHPLDPRKLNPALTPEFCRVIRLLMAKDPNSRVQSAAEVIELCTQFIDPTHPLVAHALATPSLASLALAGAARSLGRARTQKPSQASPVTLTENPQKLESSSDPGQATAVAGADNLGPAAVVEGSPTESPSQAISGSDSGNGQSQRTLSSGSDETFPVLPAEEFPVPVTLQILIILGGVVVLMLLAVVIALALQSAMTR